MLLLCPRSSWCKTSREDEPDWNHICAFQIPHLSFCWFNPPPANRALKQPERLLAGGPQPLPPFSMPWSLQEGAEAQNNLSSSADPSCPTPRDMMTVLWFFLCKMWNDVVMGNEMPLLWMGIDNQLSMGEKEEEKKPNLFNLTSPLTEAFSEVPLYLDNFSSHLYSFLLLSPPARIGHISVLRGVVPAWWEAGSIGRPKRVWKVLEVVFTK